MALLDEIMARLSSQGVASTGSTSWRLTARELQDTPDRGVAVVASGGFDGESRAAMYDRPTFTVLLRAGQNGSSELEDKITATAAALDLYSGVTNGWTYIDLRRQGDALYLGRDNNQRPMYSLNFLALRSKTSG